jgi:hypothetical protein
MRLRAVVAGLAVVAFGGVASAQPGNTLPNNNPYGPTPPPANPANPANPNPTPPPTSPDDPVLKEQVAQQLVHRAQELFDARVFTDAKQLAVEALVKSPKGAAAEHAKYLIKKINQQLGIDDDKPTEKVDLTPITDPTAGKEKPTPPPTNDAFPSRRLTTSIHAGLYTGLIGTTIGSFFSKDTPAGGAIPVGLAFGAVGGLYAPRLIDKAHWNEAQIRTAGSATVWGGMIGGLFGDIGKTRNTSSRQVLVGASIGATVGGGAGVLMARENRYTPGDIALVDTLAGIGAVGGLTMGMLMQPAETEAYSLNSVFGIAGGVAIGLIAGPQTNTTERRMLRVAGLSAAGGAAPFLLYAAIYDKGTHGDERLVGALSSIGLVAGLVVGFKLTSGMDADKDVMPRRAGDPDKSAPASLISRSSRGNWSLGYLGVQPLSPELAPQKGMAVPVLGGAW